MSTVAYDHQIFNMQKVGGISRYFCEIAARLPAQSGWRSRIIAPLHRNEHLAESRAPRLGFYLPRARRLRRAVNSALAPWLLAAVAPDVLHRTYYCAEPRPRRGSLVVTVFDMIHELFPHCFSADDPTREHKRCSVAAADRVICISHSTARDVMRLLDVPSDKISVTHLGFSDSFSRPLPNLAVEGARARPYLLYVGQRGGYKNFRRLLEAYAASPVLQREFDLVVFGGDRFNADELARIDALGLPAGTVHRETGTDADLAAAYLAAHAFVYPSEYEGFGIPPLEAMALGCPVACARTSSLPEVVGDAAECFDPTDVEQIRSVLERLAFDDERRRALISAGSARVQRFSWERCAEETADAYRKAL